MKELKAPELPKKLEHGRRERVYFIYGNESCLVRESLELLCGRFMPDIPDLNYARLDGAVCTVGDIAEQTSQLPQFSTHRLITVRDFSAEARGEKELAALCSLIEQLSDDCTLILYLVACQAAIGGKKKQDGSKAWTTLAQTVAKCGVCISCETPDRDETASLLCSRAEALGVKLKQPDALKLIDLSGLDLTKLLSELEKLSASAVRKTITSELISKLVEPSIETNIFHLARNVLYGNYDNAFEVLEKLYLQRQSPDMILNIFMDPFIDLYRAKAAAQSSLSVDDMIALYAPAYSGSRRFRAENALRDCARYSMPLLRKYIDLILEAALKFRGSRMEQNIVLEELISQLCKAKREEVRR